MKQLALVLASILLVGCAARTAVVPATPPPNAAIVYETRPCFGTCPVYRLLVAGLTGVTFVGERHTAVSGAHAVEAPGAYGRVEAHLRRWRPTGSRRYAMGEPNCPNPPTDMPSVMVRWTDGSGSVVDSLDFYYGCAAANPELAADLQKVPDLLPVKELIGR